MHPARTRGRVGRLTQLNLVYLTRNFERGSEGCTENFSGMICVYLLTRRRVVADDLIPVHAQHGWIVQAHASDARQQHAVEATLAVA